LNVSQPLTARRGWRSVSRPADRWPSGTLGPCAP
jgi:hypothetical protein